MLALITVFMFCAAGYEVLYPTGWVGATKRGPDTYGCICHGSNLPTDSILVYVTGPETVIVGSSNVYTVTMSGGPAIEGGFNVAVNAGAVYPNDTTSQLMENSLMQFELTQTQPKLFSSGSVSWEFIYQAPLVAGNDTIYSVGNSVNDDGSPAGDEFNFGADFYVTIIDTSAQTYEYVYDNGWNLVSLPLTVSDPRTTTLFATAISNAFKFTMQSGYLNADTIEAGYGFWLKFSDDDTVNIFGSELTSFTIPVSEGWNIIGSIAFPIATASITSEPGGLVTSPFYGYRNGYQIVDTLQPSKGYWVKLSQAGELTLSSVINNSSLATIKIVPSSELPPAPPFDELSNSISQFPNRFCLEQNYPNPFNPITVFSFRFPVSGYVTLKVYNFLGEEVATLIDEFQDSGYRSVSYDATGLPSGIYMYKLTVGSYSEAKKMILLK
ncbi:MAG: T9SS type A sorting domain-containing protein [Bacteroidetes bacterium]|nr:MAG: T9SS type A sorting domain-containing protein [Bacteroidota bacterium]